MTYDGPDRAACVRWCILWSRAQHTLGLAASLNEAGIVAWAPSRIVKRDAPGNRRRVHMGQRKVMIEVAQPIFPGLVFARAEHLDDLFRLIDAPLSEHPRFRVFQVADRVPLVGDAQIGGLRAAEAEALATINAEREAETRDLARRERAKRLGSERAQRKALRQERRAFEPGTDVTVDEMPAFAGMVGKIIEGYGTSAVIAFGGLLTITVEAWQVRPTCVMGGSALTGAAA